jgi:uncharacterized coiled-coil protein SlyX
MNEFRNDPKRIDPRVFSSDGPLVDLTPRMPPPQVDGKKVLATVKKEMENELREISGSVTANGRMLENKLEIFDKKLNLLVTRFQAVVDEQNLRYKDLSSKVREGSKYETRIESLIEKHNQIVSVFENRMNRLQKVIDEQNLKLLEMSALLTEARRKIDRL